MIFESFHEANPLEGDALWIAAAIPELKFARRAFVVAGNVWVLKLQDPISRNSSGISTLEILYFRNATSTPNRGRVMDRVPLGHRLFRAHLTP